jgi:hypothetical protein
MCDFNSASPNRLAPSKAEPADRRWCAWLIVFENVAQFFFQLAFGEYVFHSAPSRFAAFAYGNRFGAPLGTFQ